MIVQKRHLVILGAVLAALAGVIPSLALAFTPKPFSLVTEIQNFSKIEERQAIYDTPAYQLLLGAVGAQNRVAAVAELVHDPGRVFAADLCWSG